MSGIIILVGFVWSKWDRKAFAPIALMLVGAVLLIVEGGL